jgi:hypothetical protein
MVVAEKHAGRRIMCPRCSRPVRVPLHFRGDEDDELLGAPEQVEEEPIPLPHSTHFGIAALTLATVSVLVLCIPVVGYLSIALSALGLLLGLIGLVTYSPPERDPPGRGRSRPQRDFLGIDLYARGFPWLGIVASLLAIGLAVAPFILEWYSLQQKP